jgi:hypothetical protein
MIAVGICSAVVGGLLILPVAVNWPASWPGGMLILIFLLGGATVGCRGVRKVFGDSARKVVGFIMAAVGIFLAIVGGLLILPVAVNWPAYWPGGILTLVFLLGGATAGYRGVREVFGDRH